MLRKPRSSLLELANSRSPEARATTSFCPSPPRPPSCSPTLPGVLWFPQCPVQGLACVWCVPADPSLGPACTHDTAGSPPLQNKQRRSALGTFPTPSLLTARKSGSQAVTPSVSLKTFVLGPRNNFAIANKAQANLRKGDVFPGDTVTVELCLRVIERPLGQAAVSYGCWEATTGDEPQLWPEV